MPTRDEVFRNAAPALRRLVELDRQREAEKAKERDERGAAA